MKKLLSLLLVLVLAVGVFAACGQKVNEDLEAAGAYIDALYKNEATNTTVDYDVVANVVYNGTTYPITWSVNVESGVTIVDSANAGFKTVKVERGDADLNYTLTATITDGEDTVTKSFERVVPAKVSQAAIVDAAYQLAAGETMDGTQTLTGKIISIDTPYDAGYKNVTVTIVVDNLTDKPIQCYRLKGDQAADLKVGDTITVEGTITNYKGTIEFNAGCVIKAYTAWVPTEAEKVTFEKNALTLPETVYMDGNVALVATGATYTDVAITWTATGATITEGNLVVVQTAEEQTVTLTATLTCGAATETKTITVKITPKDNRVAQPVTALDTIKTYVLAMNQLKLAKRLFATGEMNGYYAATSEAQQLAAAAQVELVSGTTDKYYLKITVGTAVKYVNMVTSTSGDKTYVNIKLEDAASTQYTFNTTYGTLVANVEGADYFFGVVKDKTHDTFGPVTANADNYPVTFYELVNPDLTPAAERIATELSSLTLPADITTAVVDVPTVGTNYANVSITWSSTNAAVAVNGGKLNFTLPATAGFTKDVKITATVACEGADSQTKEFTVTLWKLPTTEAEMVSVLYSLEKGMTVPGKYTLTGRVVSFDTDGAYSSTYHNVSIWVMVGNDAEHPVLVFRLKDVDNNDATISLIKVGDTITVENGTLTDYNTKKEITGATIKSYTAWVPTEQEKVGIEHTVLDVDTDIAVNTTLTLPAIGATYTDVAITWTADGAPVSGNYEITLGDTAREITLVATVSLGNTTLQKTFTLAVAAKPAEAPIKVNAPVVGQTYKLAIYQANKGKFLYLTGAINGTTAYQLATSDAMADAIDVTLEAVDGVDGAFRLYFMNAGVKTYIDVYERTASSQSGSLQLVTTAPERYYTVDPITGTAVVEGTAGSYYMGAFNNNAYIGGSCAEKYIWGENAANLGVSQFPVCFYSFKQVANFTADEKVAQEKEYLAIEIPEAIVSATDVTLVTDTVLFDDVTVTWEATGATIVDNKVTLTPGTTEQTVTLTATIAATGATAVTKTWTITVPAADNRVAVPVTNFQVDTAYKMKSQHNTAGEIYYNGTKPGSSGANLSVTSVKNEACDVYLTAGTDAGTYYIYILDGTTKLYLTLNSNNKYLFTTQTEANVVPTGATLFTYDSTNDAWTYGSGRFMGTGVSNSSADIRTYAASNISNASYAHVQLVTFQ
ncbi:MAG: hypothetical protein IJW48_01700 [Clostridia bacterium]|nr:hypothetical protein [Clostridia bacterium]